MWECLNVSIGSLQSIVVVVFVVFHVWCVPLSNINWLNRFFHVQFCNQTQIKVQIDHSKKKLPLKMCVQFYYNHVVCSVFSHCLLVSSLLHRFLSNSIAILLRRCCISTWTGLNWAILCVCVCTSIDSTLKFFQSRAQHKQQHCRSFVEILFFLLFVHFYLCKLHIVDWTIWWIGGCSYIFYYFWYFPISRTTLCVFVSWFCDLNLMHRYGNYGIILPCRTYSIIYLSNEVIILPSKHNQQTNEWIYEKFIEKKTRME